MTNVTIAIIDKVVELQNKQKGLLKWSMALVGMLIVHMLLDPILHWGS